MHSTDNLDDGYLGSGTLVRRSIKKYGKENHSIEILEFLNSREELAAREKEVVNLQEVARKECMNLKVGGLGGFTSENAKKGRQALLQKYSSKEISEWSKKGGKTTLKKHGLNKKWLQARASFKGKTHKSESIEKMKKAAVGRGTGDKNSQYGTIWITNGKENKKIKKGLESQYPGWWLGRKLN